MFSQECKFARCVVAWVGGRLDRSKHGSIEGSPRVAASHRRGWIREIGRGLKLRGRAIPRVGARLHFPRPSRKVCCGPHPPFYDPQAVKAVRREAGSGRRPRLKRWERGIVDELQAEKCCMLDNMNKL